MKKTMLLVLIILNLFCKKEEPFDPLKDQFWLYWLSMQPVNICPQPYSLLDAGTHVIPLKQNETYYFDIKPRLDNSNNKNFFTLSVNETPGQDVKIIDPTQKCITNLSNSFNHQWDGGTFGGDNKTGVVQDFLYKADSNLPEKGYLSGFKLMTTDSTVSITIPSIAQY